MQTLSMARLMKNMTIETIIPEILRRQKQIFDPMMIIISTEQAESSVIKMQLACRLDYAAFEESNNTN
jgi:hypothetical protein